MKIPTALGDAPVKTADAHDEELAAKACDDCGGPAVACYQDLPCASSDGAGATVVVPCQEDNGSHHSGILDLDSSSSSSSYIVGNDRGTDVLDAERMNGSDDDDASAHDIDDSRITKKRKSCKSLYQMTLSLCLSLAFLFLMMKSSDHFLRYRNTDLLHVPAPGPAALNEYGNADGDSDGSNQGQHSALERELELDREPTTIIARPTPPTNPIILQVNRAPRPYSRPNSAPNRLPNGQPSRPGGNGFDGGKRPNTNKKPGTPRPYSRPNSAPNRLPNGQPSRAGGNGFDGGKRPNTTKKPGTPRPYSRPNSAPNRLPNGQPSRKRQRIHEIQNVTDWHNV